VLDFMGFAQKGGAVLSYVRLGVSPSALNQVRIDKGRADAAILCDLVVGTDPRALAVMRKDKTRAVANIDILPTADFIRNRNIDFGGATRLKALKTACGEKNVGALDAAAVAEGLLGDLVYANMFLLGFAWQKGLAPVSGEALVRAIELNGVSVKQNLKAFALGRAAAVDGDAVASAAGLKPETREQSLAELVARRQIFLRGYQNMDYGSDYAEFVGRIAEATKAIPGADRFAQSLARGLFKLMAYKDEYEVARLYADDRFRRDLASAFTGEYRLKFNLAPPFLGGALDDQGRPMKKEFGGWMAPAFSLLARFKFLRGTALDPFGFTAERRLERRLIGEYRARIEGLAGRLTAENIETAIAIASLPEDIRGYGPVKLASVTAAEEKLKGLMAKFDSSDMVRRAA
jgi:indolepyruvate ferredoxin oxidoreductase